jgi:hypothetical protein
MNPSATVRIRVTSMLTKANLAYEKWFRDCDEAERRGEPEPPMPHVPESDFRTLVAVRVKEFSNEQT